MKELSIAERIIALGRKEIECRCTLIVKFMLDQLRRDELEINIDDDINSELIFILDRMTMLSMVMPENKLIGRFAKKSGLNPWSLNVILSVIKEFPELKSCVMANALVRADMENIKLKVQIDKLWKVVIGLAGMVMFLGIKIIFGGR